MGEMEMSDYTTVHELGGFKRTETNSNSNTEQSERRLFRIGLITIGVLCIVQATLNIYLRLHSYSTEDTDQFPFNSSVIEEVCQIDRSQQNSTQFCFCCNKLLRRLLREIKSLEKDRYRLQDTVSQLSGDMHGDFPESGSGSLDEFEFGSSEF